MTTLSLKDYLLVNDVSQSSLAKQIGVTGQLLNYWIRSSKEDIYVEYSVLTGHICKVYANRVVYEAGKLPDLEKAL